MQPPPPAPSETCCKSINIQCISPSDISESSHSPNDCMPANSSQEFVKNTQSVIPVQFTSALSLSSSCTSKKNSFDSKSYGKQFSFPNSPKVISQPPVVPPRRLRQSSESESLCSVSENSPEEERKNYDTTNAGFNNCESSTFKLHKTSSIIEKDEGETLNNEVISPVKISFSEEPCDASVISKSETKGSLRSALKKTSSVNWLDRSSSIVDLEALFKEVQKSRENISILKHKDSIKYGGNLGSNLSIPNTMSRCKSVGNIHSMSKMTSVNSDLSRSSWELYSPPTPPSRHKNRNHSSRNSVSFSEDNSTSPASVKKKHFPMRRFTTCDPDPVYYTVHSELSSSTKPSKRSPLHRTPAFQEDAYYTIQGPRDVTTHYQADESLYFVSSDYENSSPPIQHRLRASPPYQPLSSSSSDDEDFYNTNEEFENAKYSPRSKNLTDLSQDNDSDCFSQKSYNYNQHKKSYHRTPSPHFFSQNPYYYSFSSPPYHHVYTNGPTSPGLPHGYNNHHHHHYSFSHGRQSPHYNRQVCSSRAHQSWAYYNTFPSHHYDADPSQMHFSHLRNRVRSPTTALSPQPSEYSQLLAVSYSDSLIGGVGLYSHLAFFLLYAMSILFMTNCGMYLNIF